MCNIAFALDKCCFAIFDGKYQLFTNGGINVLSYHAPIFVKYVKQQNSREIFSNEDICFKLSLILSRDSNIRSLMN